jgi:4-hydroxybenzoate polyprenyltransferase
MRTNQLAQKPLSPLVVNINGSLVKADSLFESVIVTILRKPTAIFALLLALLRGRPAFKRCVAELGVHDLETLPLREDMVAFLRQEKERGRELHIATAADQAVADSIAARVGVFDSAEGSRGSVNFKGPRKLERLRERFPEGFACAVNDVGDRDTWRAASSVVLVGANARTRRAVLRHGCSIEQEIPISRPTLRHWIRAVRIHQWSKNLLLFVPLMLAHKYVDVNALLRVVLGFFTLGFITSGTYLINDLSDLAADRAHEAKRYRPIAQADIAPASALAVALALLAVGLFEGSRLGLSTFALLLVYIGLSFLYSLHFKRFPIIDVFLLGSLYTLRIFMGSVLVESPLSAWLLVFSLFFFLSMSMAKRHVEIVKAPSSAGDKLIEGRGYRPSDAPLSLAFGVSSSVGAVLILFLYIVNDAYPAGAYHHPDWLWVIGFAVFLWTSRIWLLSHRGELDDDPVAFALRDPVSWLLGAVVVGVFAMATL